MKVLKAKPGKLFFMVVFLLGGLIMIGYIVTAKFSYDRFRQTAKKTDGWEYTQRIRYYSRRGPLFRQSYAVYTVDGKKYTIATDNYK